MVKVSRGLATKVRDLTKKGKLAWLLSECGGTRGHRGPSHHGNKYMYDVVYERARVNHTRRLAHVAEEFEKELYLLPPRNAGSWVPPQEKRHGMSELRTGTHPIGVHPHYVWKPDQEGSDGIRLAVEDGLYFSRLKHHVPDAKAWDSFNTWKENGAVYLHSCRLLVTDIVCECQRLKGAAIIMPEEWMQGGLYWGFPERVYYHCTSLAEEDNGFSGLTCKVKQVERCRPEKVEIHTLHHAEATVACH